MAVLYRAIWNDSGDRDSLLDAARSEFTTWLATKADAPFELPDSGSKRQGLLEVEVDGGSDDRATLLRLRLREDKDQEFWTTSLVVIVPTSPAETPWVWIDVEWVDEDLFGRPPVFSAPRVARALLNARGGRCGSLVLSARPRLIVAARVSDYIAELVSPERDAPVVVFTRAPEEDEDEAHDRTLTAANRLAGVAAVWLLPDAAASSWRAALGDDLHVWAGATRIYFPGLDLSDGQAWRHRYLPHHRLDRRPDGAARWVAKMLGTQASARRPPVLYREVGRELLRESGDGDFWLTEATRLENELVTVRARIEDLELESALAADDAASSMHRADRAERRARYLENQLRRAGQAVATEEFIDVSVEPETCREVVELVRERLGTTIELPESAYECVDDLSDSHLAGRWAAEAWEGFSALDQYVREGDQVGFAVWAKNGGLPPGKWAMQESETVENNPRARRARTLPVDTRVDASGHVFMPAHLKPGGPTTDAPRIHFIDDTRGATRKIHVGYFGPHLPVPGR